MRVPPGLAAAGTPGALGFDGKLSYRQEAAATVFAKGYTDFTGLAADTRAKLAQMQRQALRLACASPHCSHLFLPSAGVRGGKHVMNGRVLGEKHDLLDGLRASPMECLFSKPMQDHACKTWSRVQKWQAPILPAPWSDVALGRCFDSPASGAGRRRLGFDSMQMVRPLFGSTSTAQASTAVPFSVGTVDSKWLLTASHFEAQCLMSFLSAAMMCPSSDERKSANAVGATMVGMIGVHARSISQHECLLRSLVLMNRVMIDGPVDKYGQYGATCEFIAEQKPHALASARVRQLVVDHHMNTTVELQPPPGVAELEGHLERLRGVVVLDDSMDIGPR